MTRQHSPLITLSSLLVVAALFVAACGASKDNGNASQFTALTPDNPIVQIPEGLALSANPTSIPPDFGVQLKAIPAETFTNGQAGPQWDKAITGLPAGRRLRGPLYEIKTTGKTPGQLFLSVVMPSDSNPAALDLYGWDGEKWSFLPAHPRGNQLVADVSTAPLALGLFEAASTPPLAFTTLEPGQALTAAAATGVNGVLLGGVNLQANGALAGQLPNAALDQSIAVYPVVRNYAAGGSEVNALPRLLIDVAVRANHLQSLVSFAVSGAYDGLALDYRGLNESLTAGYAEFVRDLAAQLHAQNRLLFVVVQTPTRAPGLARGRANGSLVTGGYDWRALGASADALLVPLPDDPQSVGDGLADALLTWAVGEADRSRIRLLTSALNVDGAAGQFALLDQASALAPLGSVTAVQTAPTPVSPGQPITVTLSGKAQKLEYDSLAFATRYTYLDAAESTHTVWLTSAHTLRQRLALAAKYHLGGVVVTDLLAPGVPENLAAAITQYKVNLKPPAQTQAGFLWTVGDASGLVVAQATAQPDQPYVFVADQAGDYRFSAELQDGNSIALGFVDVSVSKTLAQQGSQGSQGSQSNQGSQGNQGGSQGSTQTDNTGGFAPPPPIAAGNFELGGQVPGFIAHPGEMKQSGMTWVKYQAIDPAGSIAEGHAAGFKVLISAVGERERAADPAYWPEYAQWVASIAALGADAIEVWNEANLDREWPNGQISGPAYTEMLRQAYTAIKAANPGVMVIGGAPSPTGAAGSAGCTPAFCNDDVFIQQMAAAGAASYMDCVGVHFNSGTTSPQATSGSALSGYHYSFYFWPMVDLYYNTFGGSRPLCFTELGYVSPEGYESIPLPAYFQWAAGTSVAEQAQWLAESASLAAGSGKVRMMIVFNVDFTHYLSNDPQAGYAILRPDGSCPACAALDAVMP